MGKCNKLQKGGGSDPNSTFNKTTEVPSNNVEKPTKSTYNLYDANMKVSILRFLKNLYAKYQNNTDLPEPEKEILSQMLTNLEKENEGKYRAQWFHNMTTGKDQKIGEKNIEIGDHFYKIFDTKDQEQPLSGTKAIEKLKEMYPGIEKTSPLTSNIGVEEHSYISWFKLYDEYQHPTAVEGGKRRTRKGKKAKKRGTKKAKKTAKRKARKSRR